MPRVLKMQTYFTELQSQVDSLNTEPQEDQQASEDERIRHMATKERLNIVQREVTRLKDIVARY